MGSNTTKSGRGPGNARPTGKGAKRPLQLHLDGLMAGLGAIGKPVTRSEAIALLARAAGLRNVHELERLAADGALAPAVAVPMGGVDAGDGTRLDAFRAGGVAFAVEAGTAADGRYVLCPTGGIVDIGAGAAAAPIVGRRFHRTRVWFDVLSDEPIPDGMDVGRIMEEADTGMYVAGGVGRDAKELDEAGVAAALVELGSDPGFFGFGRGEDADEEADEDADEGGDEFDGDRWTARLDRFERENEATVEGIVSGLRARGVPQEALDELVHEIGDRLDHDDTGEPGRWASGVNNEGFARQVALVLMEDGVLDGTRLIEESAREALAGAGA